MYGNNGNISEPTIITGRKEGSYANRNLSVTNYFVLGAIMILWQAE